MNTAAEHEFFAEHLDAYLADGLSADERRALEAHAAECQACTELLAHAQSADANLMQLFQTIRPGAEFETRLLRRLDASAAPRRYRAVHPLVLRAAAGAAAAVLLGGVGYAFQYASTHDRLPTPWAKATGVAADRSEGVRRLTALASTRPALRSLGWGESDFERDGAERGSAAADSHWYFRQSDARSEVSRSKADSLATLRELERTTSDEVRGRGGETTAEAGKPASAAPPGLNGPSVANGPSAGGALSYGVELERIAGQQPVTGRFYGGGAPPAELGVRLKEAPQVTNLAAGVSVPEVDGLAANGVVKQEWPKQLNFKPADNFYETRVERRSEMLGRDMPALAKQLADSNMLGRRLSESEAAGVKVAAVEEKKAHGGDGAEARDKLAAAEAAVVVAQPAAVAADLEDGSIVAPAVEPPPQTPQPPANPPTTADSPLQRKIIRNGEMTFEVDSFDSALLQISKIALEETGFVATTSSEKLANGKVKGSVVVRVPPDRLDTLVLKLRGLGDLRASRIAAQDITKQYTDIDSQLRAAHAMENRLLEIIKTGKGEIKDLIEAEKQLGEWREKIERLEGEIRYYNNLVSLSTLTIELNERDIRTASMVTEAEQVNMGIETPDVEKARAAALAAIDEAKGRIIESDLKRLEAGQFLSRIVAEAKPDAAGPLTDRLKQLGRVARLEIERKQKSPEGAPVPAAGVRVEKADTRFIISIYNLAAVAPRVTTNLNLAAPDVEAAYRTILDQVQAAGGRVVTSQLNRLGAAQTTGTISFETPADQGDVVIGAIRAAGEVMKLEVNQNTDTQNSTESKRGFVLQVYSMAAVNPRETTDVQVAAMKVAEAFAALREVVRTAEGRVLTSQLAAQDAANETAQLVFEVPRAQQAAIEQALQKAGSTTSRSVNRSQDAENTVDSKVRYSLTLIDQARLNPQQTVDSKLAVKDVSPVYAKLLDAVRVIGATVIQSQLTADPQAGGVTGTLVFDIRGEAARAALEKSLAEAGDVYARTVSRSPQSQGTLEDKTRISVTIIDAQRLPPRESTTIGVEVNDVERSKGNLEATAIALGGTSTATVSRERNGDTIAQLTLFVPLTKKAEMIRNVRDQGKVVVIREEADPNTSEGQFARAKLMVTLGTAEQIVSDQESLATSIRRGLAFSAQGLLWSLQWIIVGVCFVLPWVAILWLLARWVRRSRKNEAAPAASPPTVAG